ncbi:sensor histidine kinase [Streptomyces somaliensis]|uniref:ATP-binding protein n=1 Tax=Streptomyces somaliensis TaxID=78355 RepID=UPI0020CD0069|nr:sensor histidine kinase [Streptomyces somaliensis]MCP9946370.1 sensor histidine kinase [Streptomyces somaliensis]MCP9973250.1 sensor histidine kinase [Streptomyces somaliensis]
MPGRPRRVASLVLLTQLAIAAVTTVLTTALFLVPLSERLDDQATHRALAIAQTVASRDALAAELARTEPEPGNPVQGLAERVRRTTGAEYVVVMDERGIRYSHPNPGLVGQRVSTDPGRVLAGHDVRQIDAGTLGRTARGKTPVRTADGEVVGAVSVGIRYQNVRDRLVATVPQLLGYAAAALAVGVLAALAVSRAVGRRTRGLTFGAIAALLDEREAMLHGIREGVVALDRHGRVRLVNDEAQRLLGLPGTAVPDGDGTGAPLEELLGPGRVTDVLTGRVRGADLMAVHRTRVLVVNRMPTQDGGAVATLRDRTELEALGRALDSTRALLDALRATDHEHANRLHTLLGLLELGLYDEAAEFVGEAVGDHRVVAEQIAERVGDPLLSALLVGKATVAAERGVALRLGPGTRLTGTVLAPHDLVTVVGNLIDNALDSVAGQDGPEAERLVEAELWAEGTTAVIRVRDTGPGVPEEQREAVFTEGWSTKPPLPDGRRGRGIGLALVRRHAERYGGSVTVAAGGGGGAEFTVVLPEALAACGDGEAGGTGGEAEGTEETGEVRAWA